MKASIKVEGRRWSLTEQASFLNLTAFEYQRWVMHGRSRVIHWKCMDTLRRLYFTTTMSIDDLDMVSFRP